MERFPEARIVRTSPLLAKPWGQAVVKFAWVGERSVLPRAVRGRPCSVYKRLRLIRRRGAKHQHYLAVQGSPAHILPHVEL